MGLCFSGLFFFSTTIFLGGGEPMRSRANSLTAVSAWKRFFLLLFLAIPIVSNREGVDPSVRVLPVHFMFTKRATGRASNRMCNNRAKGRDQAMEERDFFDEKQEKKPASLNCPHCHQSAEYEVTWIVRTKKRQLSGRADERDRARFAKARSYMVRKDDMMACKNMRCRKRFEISGQSTVITE